MKKNIKIALIVLVVLAILLVAYLIWIYFISPGIITGSAPAETGKGDGEITAAELQMLSNQLVFDYWLKGDEIYFIALNGNIYKISPSGAEEKIIDQTINNLSEVKPSADGSKVIISFGYPFQETFSIFHTANKTWQPLPAGTAAAAWHPKNADQAAILKNNGGPSSLALYALSDKKTKEILKITQKDLKIDWVLPEEIYLAERSVAQVPASVWSVNIAKKTIRPIIKEINGLMTRWFNEGQNGLKFSSLNRGGLLEVIDKNDKTLARLPVITMPEKCAVGATAIYCGASSNFESAILPDDYLKGKLTTADNLYEIPQGLFEPNFISIYRSDFENLPINIYHPKLKNNRLIFINRLDNKLYSLGL